MGKPIIRILYFQRRGIDANGYYKLNYIIQRGRKILYYATETKDFEYSDCFTSSCLAERKETILDTVQYIFKVHKVRYSRLILSPSYSYITRYKSRIRQICTATRFCKSDIIWTMCPGVSYLFQRFHFHFSFFFQFEPLYTFLNPDLYNKLNQLMRTAVSLLPPVKSSGSFYPAN